MTRAAKGATFQGNDCKRCHGGLRYIATLTCVACTTERNARKYRELKASFAMGDGERIAAAVLAEREACALAIEQYARSRIKPRRIPHEMRVADALRA